MNEITQKWLATGLLDQLDESKHDEMARILDTIAIKLIADAPPDNTPEKRKHEQFCGIVLPVARRVFEDIEGKSLDADWLYEDFKNYYEKEGSLIKELNCYISQDGEAEFCLLYSELCVKKVKENKL